MRLAARLDVERVSHKDILVLRGELREVLFEERL